MPAIAHEKLPVPADALTNITATTSANWAPSSGPLPGEGAIPEQQWRAALGNKQVIVGKFSAEQARAWGFFEVRSSRL
jgi:hypothetical protein